MKKISLKYYKYFILYTINGNTTKYIYGIKKQYNWDCRIMIENHNQNELLYLIWLNRKPRKTHQR